MEWDEIYCSTCKKWFDTRDLNVIDGMAACPNDCGQVFILDHVELPIVARIAKEGDRERRI